MPQRILAGLLGWRPSHDQEEYQRAEERHQRRNMEPRSVAHYEFHGDHELTKQMPTSLVLTVNA